MIQDVPPFMVLEGHPSRVRKVNIIGLERAGISQEDIQELRAAFRRIYRSGEPRHRVLKQLSEEETGLLVRELVEALQRTESGSKGRFRETLREEFIRTGRERVAGAPTA